MKDKLLKIIDNFIDNVHIICRPNSLKKERIEIDDYGLYSIRGLARITRTSLTINGVEIDNHDYSTQYPTEIREGRNQKIFLKTIWFRFKNEPPISLHKGTVPIKKSIPLKLEQPKRFFNWGKPKIIDAVLNYTEEVPKYYMKCEPFEFEIEEAVFNQISNKIEDKKDASQKLMEIEKQNKTEKIIEERFNQIVK